VTKNFKPNRAKSFLKVTRLKVDTFTRLMLSGMFGNKEQNWVQNHNSVGDVITNGPDAHGGTPSAALYASQQKYPPYLRQTPPSDVAPPLAIQTAILSELSIDTQIPMPQLVSGEMADQDWPKFTEAVGSFYDRWKDQPAKLAGLRNLIEVIDDAYFSLLEKREAA
jgi:hypothetical protein